MNDSKTTFFACILLLINAGPVFGETLCSKYKLCSTLRAHGLLGEKIIDGSSAISRDPPYAARHSLFYAEDAVRRSGLKLNYEVAWIENIGHAYAYISEDNDRWILIDPKWAIDLIEQYKSSFPLTWILAHEIGHHVKNHDFYNIHEEELEADQFGGRILGQMFVYKWQAQRWLSKQNSDSQGEGYPEIQERINAVSIGYDRGCDNPLGVFIMDERKFTGNKTAKCQKYLKERDIANPPTIDQSKDNEGQVLFGSIRGFVSSAGKEGGTVLEELKKKGVY